MPCGRAPAEADTPSNSHDVRALFAKSESEAMFRLLQVLTLLLASIVMGLSLAHALELPGKLRLNRETYLAVQRIYYPGFTYGGVAEPASILAVVALLLVGPASSSGFWLTFAALIALVAMQAIFWLVAQPANKFWLAGETLDPASARFFATKEALAAPAPEWTVLCDRWEYSHLARALLALAAYILLLIATMR
jgi:hypothetical protein